jgi:hypothetical protein
VHRICTRPISNYLISMHSPPNPASDHEPDWLYAINEPGIALLSSVKDWIRKHHSAITAHNIPARRLNPAFLYGLEHGADDLEWHAYGC